jgi:ribosomal protein S18 acetylase RimI-like enzyme
MVSFRPFEESDNERMLDIQNLCPQGNDKWAMGVDKKSSIIARYLMFDNWKVLVAEDGGTVAGWIGWTLKQSPSQERPYAYLSEVMVHPDFRGRGIATKLAEAAEKDAKNAGAGHLYCYIYEANQASKSVFERLGYSAALIAKECAMPIFKKARISNGFSIEHISRGDVSEVVKLINDFNFGRMHFEPFTPEAFEARTTTAIPGYGLEDIWVAKEDGRIVACAGLWDSSVLAEVYYAREPLELKILGKIFGVLDHITKLPKIAGEGEHFKFLFLADWLSCRRQRRPCRACWGSSIICCSIPIRIIW